MGRIQVMKIPRARVGLKEPAPLNGNGLRAVEDTQEQLRHLLKVVKAVREGDFSARIEFQPKGIVSEIGEVLNDIFELYETTANEFIRVGKIVGQEGRT